MGLRLEQLGELIRSRRLELGLPATELAAAAGISPVYLWVIEKASNPKTKQPSRPSPQVLGNLARELNLDRQELFRLAGYDDLVRPEVGIGLAIPALPPDQREAVESFYRRAQYFKASLAVAMLTRPPDMVILCRVDHGPYAGDWQFPAGYVDPIGERDALGRPKLKAEKEIRKYLGVEPQELPFLGTLTDHEPKLISFSELGLVEAHVYNYFVSADLSSRLGLREHRIADFGKRMADVAEHVYELLDLLAPIPARRVESAVARTTEPRKEALNRARAAAGTAEVVQLAPRRN